MSNPWEKIYTSSNPDDFKDPYPLFDLAIHNLKASNSKKVLDITTGNGRHLIELARNGFETYGFDISDKIIDLSSTNLKKLNLSANLMVSDMFKEYPYQDNFFDGVVAIQALYHGSKENFYYAIKEVRRVLKKGKPFIFTVSKSYKRCMDGSYKKEFEVIDDRTIIPLTGREKGLMHFFPNKKIIKDATGKLFENTKIIDDDDNHYYLVQCK